MDLKGPLDLLGLGAILKVAGRHRISLGIAIEHLVGRGEIVVTDGLITWARLGRTRGEEAVKTFLSWSGARFRVCPHPGTAQQGAGVSPLALLEDGDGGDPSGAPAGSAGYVPASGSLEILGFAQILHLFLENGLAARIGIRSGGREGRLEVDSGRVLTAWFGDDEGKSAMEALLRIPDGEVEIYPGTLGLSCEDPFPIDLFLDPAVMREEPEVEAAAGGGRRDFDTLPPVEQMRVARQGGFKERLEAACAASDQVALAVVQDHDIGPELAEAIAGKVMVNPSVLKFLADDPTFRNQYMVARALVFNPSTPPSSAADLLDRLRDPDIRQVVADPAAHPEHLRVRAKRVLDLRKAKRAL